MTLTNTQWVCVLGILILFTIAVAVLIVRDNLRLRKEEAQLRDEPPNHPLLTEERLTKVYGKSGLVDQMYPDLSPMRFYYDSSETLLVDRPRPEILPPVPLYDWQEDIRRQKYEHRTALQRFDMEMLRLTWEVDSL